MSEKETFLTEAGLLKLQKELEYLNGEKSIEIARRLEEARSHGDLSENSEYDEAKRDQAENAMKIELLKQKLKNVVIIDEKDLKTDVVSLGVVVVLHDVEFDEDVEYHIVGSTEANPMKNMISNESPVGAAIIGHKVGDVVDVQTPAGACPYEIKEIKLPN
ncbi:MAG: transcription elongation factor GreA [Ruminococcaceae bacterium]|nr:transcription elongation factor GreA [Oscillospiraceae bacterium]